LTTHRYHRYLHSCPTRRSSDLEIRYATTNNFLGTRFYSEARAFMQRPAAEAVVRVNRKLKDQGYGLLVHDAYRPWYVTKVFWDADRKSTRLNSSHEWISYAVFC